MTAKFWDGKPLFIDGKLAMHARCCCGYVPDPPEHGPCFRDGYPGPFGCEDTNYYPPDIMMEVSGLEDQVYRYSLLNGSWELPAWETSGGGAIHGPCSAGGWFRLLGDDHHELNLCVETDCYYPNSLTSCFCYCGHFYVLFLPDTIEAGFITMADNCALNNTYMLAAWKAWNGNCAAVDVTFTKGGSNDFLIAPAGDDIQIHIYTQ